MPIALLSLFADLLVESGNGLRKGAGDLARSSCRGDLGEYGLAGKDAQLGQSESRH